MTSPLPTSLGLDALVAALETKCWPISIAADIEAIRRAQDHATLESVDRASVTRPAPGAPVVFDISEFRASRGMVYHDDDPEAA